MNGLGIGQLDLGFDASVLARLTKLEIVAVAASWYSGGNPCYKEERKNWLEWFEGLVEYAKSKVSSSLCVELDNDGGEEATDAIVARHFPKTFRNVRTESGDCFFGRKALGKTSFTKVIRCSE